MVATLEFPHIYSYPGNMEEAAKKFYELFARTKDFLLPIEIDNRQGLGWVLLELLNNAVRSPISLAINSGLTDINHIDFFTDIVIRKEITETDRGFTILLSVMNRGPRIEIVISSIRDILDKHLSVLDCEERFRLNGSYTGNGGMGILLSMKTVENEPGGTMSLSWHDGYYDFSIAFERNGCF